MTKLHNYIPRLHRPYYRNGLNHRDGADVSFSDISKLFHFSSISIGKWVTVKEQQIAANLIFDAFCDLMDILAVPERVISLNGSLSLAFGTGGQKSSSAHYNSATHMLALAKNAGGGALAHEWFHAFDHHVAKKMFDVKGTHLFASKLWLDNVPLIPHSLNNYLSDCFESIFLDKDNGIHAYVSTANAADRALKTYYYSQPQELSARAFEACIQDQPIKNSFLVQGTKQSHEAQIGLYPETQQRTELTKQFLQYFYLLGLATE